MKKISTIGLDLAKRVFQVHGIDDQGNILVQKQLSRSEVLAWFEKIEPCLIGMESCATSTYWAREIGKFGHNVKLMPPAYVKPYVRRQKNDRTDAAAICEAVGRPTMRFVALKTLEQQSVQVLHRTRELLILQRTQTMNALRAHLAEFGLIFVQRNVGIAQAIKIIQDAENTEIPAFVRQVLSSLVEQLKKLKGEIAKLDAQMVAWHRSSADSLRLATIPGVGAVTASALIAAIGDGKQFRSAREFASWIGMVPRQHSSGGKERLGRISKQGNAYLRTLLVLGATGLLRGSYRKKAVGGSWFNDLLQRKPKRVASIALANKMARVAWAVLTKGGVYRCTEAT
jgi:transposase